MEAPNYIANGTIQPSRFVKIDTTAGKNFYVIQGAAAADNVLGIAQEGSYDPPGVTGALSDAARAGLPLKVYSLGDVCLLKIGVGGCTAGDLLSSDASGQGVTAVNSIAFPLANVVGAMALETALAGDVARVQVVRFKI